MINITKQIINYKNIQLGVLNFLLKHKKIIIPFLFIFSYLLLYFLIDFSTQSLVAHDEGLYARRSRILEESHNWFSSPFPSPHHKTIGSYWLIALSIKLFGYSEFALRLPSVLSSFVCLVISYLIAVKISNKKSALISIVSLSSMPLWIQYSRYASPDFPFVLCILLVILFFLKFIDSILFTNKYLFIFLSGFFISIAFFIRSYMIFAPLIGLSPFLVFNLLRSRKIFTFTFISGIIFGLVPTVVSLYFSYNKFGYRGITLLFDFAKDKAIGGLALNNVLLLPLNYVYLTFPIGIFMTILFVFTKSNIRVKYPTLVYLYPLISLVILLSMSTSYLHYYLFLLPPFSILFAVQLQSNSFRFSISKYSIKYSFLAFYIVFGLTLSSLMFYYKDSLLMYSHGNILIIYFVFILLLLSFIISIKYLFDTNKTNYNLTKFFYNLVIPQYVSISLLYNFGIVGNPNYQLKSFLNDEHVSSILQYNTIYLFNVESKMNTLLSYYLPSSVNIKSLDSLSNNKYIITSDKKYLDSISGNSLFSPIKFFDKHYLLMKSSQ